MIKLRYEKRKQFQWSSFQLKKIKKKKDLKHKKLVRNLNEKISYITINL